MQPIIDIIYELAQNYIDAYFATHPRAYGYFDRGDPAVNDFEKFDFTRDTNWHALDLSSIVPADAVAIAFYARLRSPQVGRAIQLRRHGNVNAIVRSIAAVQVANANYWTDMFAACDSDRKIDYKTSADPWTTIDFAVKGWWLGGPTLSGFVNRGDPAAADFTEADFPAFQTWTDLDLSAVVPAATGAVLLRCRVWSGGNQKSLRFRTKEHSNAINISQCEAVQDGLNYYYDIQVPTNGLQTIQYWSSLGLMPIVRMTVKGWWY